MSSQRRYSLPESEAKIVRIALAHLTETARTQNKTVLAAEAQTLYDKLTNYCWRKEK